MLRPLGDGVAARYQLLRRPGRLEIGLREAAVAGVGRHSQLVLVLGIVQRIVEARHHARGVAERRVRGHVLDALAVDVDLAPVAQGVQELRARHRLGRPDLAGGLGPLGECNPISLSHGSPSLLLERRRKRETGVSTLDFACLYIADPLSGREKTIGAQAIPWQVTAHRCSHVGPAAHRPAAATHR